MDSKLFLAGIGASAGGHLPLQIFFRNLPADLPVAYIVVTHLLRDHKSELANILARSTNLHVQKITGMTPIKTGHVYVMPENVIVLLRNNFLYVRPRPAGDINQSIDIFFESLAVQKKEKAIGIILSGMGTDGSNGALKIFKNGGTVLVQQPESAQFNSMPWATIMKDHPDHILPPAELAQQLSKVIREKQIKIAS